MGGSDSLSANLRSESRRIEEDSLYSAKGHFEAARWWSAVHLWIGIPTAVLAAVASASAFKEETFLAGSLAIVVAALSAVSTFLNPNERAQSHHQAGAKHNSVRNRARVLREIDLPAGQPVAEMVASLKALAQERDELNLSSPQIPRMAFKRARAGVEGGEAQYEVDHAVSSAPVKKGDV
jgi:hypothetical protein